MSTRTDGTEFDFHRSQHAKLGVRITNALACELLQAPTVICFVAGSDGNNYEMATRGDVGAVLTTLKDATAKLDKWVHDNQVQPIHNKKGA